MKTEQRKYGRCEYCGGPVVGKILTVDRRFRGKLHEFEGVPVGVCRDCGQRVFKGSVLEQMQRLVKANGKAKKVLKVPVREFLVA